MACGSTPRPTAPSPLPASSRFGPKPTASRISETSASTRCLDMRVRQAIGFAPFLVAAMLSMATAEERYVTLTGRQIQARIIGNTLSDDVHWSEYYRPDGTLLAVDMGRSLQGRWRIRNNELCTSKDRSD